APDPRDTRNNQASPHQSARQIGPQAGKRFAERARTNHDVLAPGREVGWSLEAAADDHEVALHGAPRLHQHLSAHSHEAAAHDGRTDQIDVAEDNGQVAVDPAGDCCIAEDDRGVPYRFACWQPEIAEDADGLASARLKDLEVAGLLR